MKPAKQHIAISNVMSILREWDSGSKNVRKRILIDFISKHGNKTAPELEDEFSEASSLLLIRIISWLRLTYMIGTCLGEQLKALRIFLSACSGHKYLGEFLEVGGILTLLEILGLKQLTEEHKIESMKLLTEISIAGRKYKELICESYGIRAIAECLAKSKQEETQECARNLLQILAQGNPRFESQVYKSFIALLPCTSPKAQQMAAQTLRIVQKIVKQAIPSIVEPLLNLLKSLHLEVQYEAIELIKDLMHYEICDKLLESLVQLLRPSKEDLLLQPNILDSSANESIKIPMTVFIQQAAAAKCIGILINEFPEHIYTLCEFNLIQNLMYAMGNVEYADSQRQASMTLKLICSKFPVINAHVLHAMGDRLYSIFDSDAESLYTKIDSVQADVLRSNKLTTNNMIL